MDKTVYELFYLIVWWRTCTTSDWKTDSAHC